MSESNLDLNDEANRCEKRYIFAVGPVNSNELLLACDIEALAQSFTAIVLPGEQTHFVTDPVGS